MRKEALAAGRPPKYDRKCLGLKEPVAGRTPVLRFLSTDEGTTVVRDAWDRGQDLAVHGWVYGLTDGLVRDLKTTVATQKEVAAAYDAALAAL